MLLFEAHDVIGKRKFPKFYEDTIVAGTPNDEADSILLQANADIMAMRCIEAQQRVADLLNEFWDNVKETDVFSAHLVYEMARSFSIEAKFDSEGNLLGEDEDGHKSNS